MEVLISCFTGVLGLWTRKWLVLQITKHNRTPKRKNGTVCFVTCVLGLWTPNMPHFASPARSVTNLSITSLFRYIVHFWVDFKAC
jgi:hypothetical protein